jgi:hypothetical protein
MSWPYRMNRSIRIMLAAARLLRILCCIGYAAVVGADIVKLNWYMEWPLWSREKSISVASGAEWGGGLALGVVLALWLYGWLYARADKPFALAADTKTGPSSVSRAVSPRSSSDRHV